ncbi:MAG: hypothetical protein NZ840_00870 [Anaerolineales bacterium]|nr:hypothetical protein [Anaerolineales bacterium]MDW8160588.1 hypothetical protein [Anaerolineales bacterium]
MSLLDRDHYHLFAFQPASQKWLRLTRGEWDDLHPAISPDSRWVAFTSNREGYWDLYLLSTESGELVPLTRSPQYEGAPTWSPDGRWIAHEGYVIDPQTQQGNLEILLQEVNLPQNPQQQTLQLTTQSGADFAPQWSPRGRQIAFISQRAGENDLWIADLDRIEGRYRNLSTYTSASVRSLSWSDGGRWLLWSLNDEGVQWIYRWDTLSPWTPPRKVIPGSQPIVSEDGKILYSVLSTPHHFYLQAFSLEESRHLLPLILLSSEPQGITWVPKDFPQGREAIFESLPSLMEIFPQEVQSVPDRPITPTRKLLKPLEGVQVPFPYLHEEVIGSFQALREAIKLRAGWDFLSRLENAYLPISNPSFPSSSEEWLYTGRAIVLDSAAMNADWLIAIQEEFGVQTYWRLYLKTRYQDGTQGMPLRDLPFDLNARYSGDPIAYEQGGARKNFAPSGYWIDLTELARRYGWERLPALPSWRTALVTARHLLFLHRDHLDWYSAMLELYPVEALYTATPVPSPTLTPTRTRVPTRTPALTLTLRPTITLRATATPPYSPTFSVTP